MTIYTTPEAFEDPTPTPGQRIGTGLGKGVGSGLEMLLATKVEEMKRKKMDAAAQQLGIPPGLSPELQKEYLKQSGQNQKLQKLQQLFGGQQQRAGEGIPAESGTAGKPSPEEVLQIGAIDPNLGRIVQSQIESDKREVASRFKETKETRKEILSQARGAQESNMRLDRMEKLNEKGELINPVFNALLGKIGLDIPALKNPDSQEFEKISNDMFKGIREIFGARILSIEIDTFLKTIPTLMQSSEGKRRVIRNLKIINEGADIRRNAMKEIMKENQGTPPYDLAEQIDERISPELDIMAQEFVGSSAEQGKVEKVPDVINKKTGERLEWVDGKWRKVK